MDFVYTSKKFVSKVFSRFFHFEFSANKSIFSHFSFLIIVFLIFSFLFFFAPFSCFAASEPTLSFYGAAEEITGSCHLLDTGSEKILLDCGSFMEKEYLYRNNFFPFNPASISVVTLSHSHIDHNGRLPLLFRKGYRGPVLCAPPTRELSKIMLKIQMMIARGESRFLPYNRSDIDIAIANFHELNPKERYRLPSGTEIELFSAQHILGSSMTRVTFGPPGKKKSLLFTGDFGNEGNSILKKKTIFTDIDYLVIESTYGGKVRSKNQYKKERQKLYNILRETVDDGGVTLVPSFVLARTQKILGIVYVGMIKGIIPSSLNVYVDSPSASSITKLYAKYSDQLAKPYQGGQFGNYSPFTFRNLHLYKTFDEIETPALIIAPSADATKGKIVKYLKRYIERPDTKICFVSSYVVPGSIGEQIVKGKKQIELDSEKYDLRAKVYIFGSFSGHGDQKQILAWLKHFKKIKHVFVVHGTYRGTYKMADAIRKTYGWNVTVPHLDKTYILETGKMVKRRR